MPTMNRSSRVEVFCKKVFLGISQNSQEKTCARISLLACNFIKKETLAQMFSCKFWANFVNTFFQNTSGRLLLITPSSRKEVRNCNQYYSFFSWKKYLCFKSEERTAKKKREEGGGGLALLPINYLFKKIWSENNTYTLEFLKIAFPSIGSPNLQL